MCKLSNSEHKLLLKNRIFLLSSFRISVLVFFTSAYQTEVLSSIVLLQPDFETMRLRSKIKKPQKIDEEDDYLPSLPPARESPPRKRGLTKKEEFSLKILGTSKAFNPSLRSAAFPTLPLGTINNTLNVRANTTRAAEKKITNLEAATDFPRGVKEVLRRIAELPIQSRENTIHPIDNTNNTHDNQDALTVRDTGDRTHTVSGASIEVGTQQPHSSKILPRQIPLRRESVAENKTLPRRSGSTTAASTRQSSPANTGSVELVDLVDTPERPRAGSQSQEEVVAAIEEIFKEDPIEDRTPDSSITLVPFQVCSTFKTSPSLLFRQEKLTRPYFRPRSNFDIQP